MLKQKFLVQFASNAGIQFFAMFAGIFVARFAGPEVVGKIAYATAFASIFLFINNFWDTPHIKLLSEGKDEGDCNTTFTFLKASSLLFYLFFVLGWFLLQRFIIHYQFDSDDQEIIIGLIVFATILTQLASFTNSTYLSKLEQVRANLPVIARGFLFHLGRIIIVVLGYKAVALASWNLLSAIILLPITYSLYKKLPKGKFSPTLAKEYFKYAVPVLLIVLINSLAKYSDKLLLEHYTSTIELGYYSAAFSLGGAFILFGQTIGVIFFPLFSKNISQNKWNEVNDKIDKFNESLALMVLPIICFFILVAKPFLITLLGKTYLPSVLPFSVLLVASYLVIWGMPFANVITAMGRFYTNVWINLFKLLVFIITIYFFVSPRWLNLGALGLALSTLIVNLIHNLTFFIVANCIGKVSFYKKPLYQVLLITIVASIFIGSMFCFDIQNMFRQILLGVSFLVVVYALLFSTKLIDKNFIMQTAVLFNLKDTAKYIKSEMK